MSSLMLTVLHRHPKSSLMVPLQSTGPAQEDSNVTPNPPIVLATASVPPQPALEVGM